MNLLIPSPFCTEWAGRLCLCDVQSFEQLNSRSVAVVVDPIMSVKGKVEIDAFRCINPQAQMMGQQPRQTTSVLGHLKKPTIQALVHGLNRHYYSMVISFRRNALEEKMLMNLHKKNWKSGLKVSSFDGITKSNEKQSENMVSLVDGYCKKIEEEEEKSDKDLLVERVGRVDEKRRLEDSVYETMTTNIVQILGTMMDTIVF
eukprot:gb/GECG01009895.1/.p1 GENE.gb/GECG01009895.1/~~gb/GECG01009895.1/.p1  ORF type:complete len:202 (+),score=26.19 gb/GECG01009895.1/:1-606(+)